MIYLPLFFKGALLTVETLLLAGAISFIVGFLLGALSSRPIRVPVLSPLAEGIAFTARGIPFFVILLITYYVLPDLLGINLAPFPASVIALGFSSSGYTAQFVRGAINAVPQNQWETAFCLGLTKTKTLLVIILPQTLRMVIPNLTSELDSLLKSTAIISSIGLLELTKVGMNIVSREMNPVPVYLTLALFYLSLSALINLTTKKWEKKYA